MNQPAVLAHQWRTLLPGIALVLAVLFSARGPYAMPELAPTESGPAGCTAVADQHFTAAPRAGAAGAARVSTTLPGDHVEVLSWNIQKASKPGWRRDLAQFGQGVNLAFLQEAQLQASIREALETPLYQSFVEGYSTATMATGVMTLSTAVPSRSCGYTALEPWLGTPKATAVTYLPLEGREYPLLAVNLHAVNFALGIKEYRDQVNQIRDLVAVHPGPIIVAGDFNTWNERRQQLLDRFMTAHGLQAVQFPEDQRTRVMGHALDHIYIRGLSPERADVVPVSSSDHNPLRLRLQVLD